MSNPFTEDNDLTDKQRRILSYLRCEIDTQMYFKSRIIGEQIGLSAKEVGTNIGAIRDGKFGLTVERWGKSGGITWKVTRTSTSIVE